MLSRPRRALTSTLDRRSSSLVAAARAARRRAAGPPPSPTPRASRSACASSAWSAACSTSPPTPTTRTRASSPISRTARCVRTGYLSLTRGDGGQNLIGAEQGPRLGLIRTAGAARRAPHRRRRAVLHPRPRLRLLEDAPRRRCASGARTRCSPTWCRVIRRFRPDVIITRFSPEPSDTHGHHTASAMLALEAFRAAADPALSPRAARRRRRALAGAPDLLEPVVVEPQAERRSLAGSSSSTSAATTRCSGRRTASWRPTAAACTRARASASARARGPSLEYFKLLAAAPADAGARPPESLARRARLRLGPRSPGARRSAALVARAVRASSTRRPRTRRCPALLAIDAALDRAARRRLARAEAARAARADARLRRACSPRPPPPTFASRPAARSR